MIDGARLKKRIADLAPAFEERLAAHMARANAISRDALRQDSRSLGEVLNDAEKMPGADAARIAEVRREVANLVPAS